MEWAYEQAGDLSNRARTGTGCQLTIDWNWLAAFAYVSGKSYIPQPLNRPVAESFERGKETGLIIQ
nr:hypothetical protein Iba_chr04bCG16720 [Ipomoea batatas]